MCTSSAYDGDYVIGPVVYHDTGALQGIFSVFLQFCVGRKTKIDGFLQLGLDGFIQRGVDLVAAGTDAVGLGIVGLVIPFHVSVIIIFVFKNILEFKAVQFHQSQCCAVDRIAGLVAFIGTFLGFLDDA